MPTPKMKPKMEMFKSKAAMAKHEKKEMPSKVAIEKKTGEKDVVKKGSYKKKGK